MYDDEYFDFDVALYEGDEPGGDCDRCGEYIPNGHGHYPFDDSDERVCGDCLPQRCR